MPADRKRSQRRLIANAFELLIAMLSIPTAALLLNPTEFADIDPSSVAVVQAFGLALGYLRYALYAGSGLCIAAGLLFNQKRLEVAGLLFLAAGAVADFTSLALVRGFAATVTRLPNLGGVFIASAVVGWVRSHGGEITLVYPARERILSVDSVVDDR